MGGLKGRLTRADRKGVWGWALDASSDEKTTVEVVVDGVVAGRVMAHDPRPTVTVLPPERRDCGFQLLFPLGLSALSRHEVRARRAEDGQELKGSPIVVERSATVDAALEQTIDNAVHAAIETASTPGDLDQALRFITEQIEHLITARALTPDAEGAPIPASFTALRQRLSAAVAAPVEPIAGFAETNPAGEAARRVLVVSDAAADPGGSERGLLAHIESMVRLGLRVEFAQADHDGKPNAFTAAVQAAGAAVRSPPLDLSVEDILKRDRGLFDVVMLHRIEMYERYAALTRHYCPPTRIVYSIGTLGFVDLTRRAVLQQWQAGLATARALRERELLAALSADVVLAHSVFEAASLRESAPQVTTHVIGWPAPRPPVRRPFAARADIGFLGDYRRSPDLDAATWLAQEIMPEVRKLNPSIRCLMSASHLPASLRSFSDRGVVVVEPLIESDKFDQILDHVRVTVAPFRSGSGLIAGVVASLAAAVPCVGTPVGLEGLALPDVLQACRTDGAAALATAIVRLHDDANVSTACAKAGLQLAEKEFSVGTIDRRMRNVVGVVPGAEPELAGEARDPAVAVH